MKATVQYMSDMSGEPGYWYIELSIGHFKFALNEGHPKYPNSWFSAGSGKKVAHAICDKINTAIKVKAWAESEIKIHPKAQEALQWLSDEGQARGSPYCVHWKLSPGDPCGHCGRIIEEGEGADPV